MSAQSSVSKIKATKITSQNENIDNISIINNFIWGFIIIKRLKRLDELKG